MIKVIVKRDGKGYLANVEGRNDLFAYGLTELEAKKELALVIEAIIDIHSKKLSQEKKIKKDILSDLKLDYAI